MLDSVNNNIINNFSFTQNNNYDSNLGSPVITTRVKIGDKNLANLSETDKEQLKKNILELVQELNKEMAPINTNLIFDYEDSISSLVLTIKQADTGKIIRKIPTDEVMELMKQMRNVISIVLDTKG